MKKTSLKAVLACAVIGLASLSCKEKALATDPAQAKEQEVQKEIGEARDKADQRVWAETKKEPLYIDSAYSEQHFQRYSVKEDRALSSASGKIVKLRYIFSETDPAKTQKTFICLKDAPDAEAPKPTYACFTPQELQTASRPPAQR